MRACLLALSLLVVSAGPLWGQCSTSPFTVAPGSLNFSQTFAGQSSNQPLTLCQDMWGIADVFFDLSDNVNFSPPASTFLESGGESMELVTFHPQGPGTFNATLTVTIIETVIGLTAEGETPPRRTIDFVIPLSGVAVTVAPASLDFGSVSVASFSSQDITFTQVLQEAGTVTLTSDNPAFFPSPGSIFVSQGETVMASIFFTPQAEGPTSGTISLAVGGVTYATVSVSGTGLLFFTATPSSIDFGSVIVGNSAAATVTLDQATFFLAEVTFSSSDPQFSVTPPLVFIPSESSADVEVIFTPTSEGPQSATITIDAVEISGLSPEGRGFTPPRRRLTVGTLEVSGSGGIAFSFSPSDVDFGEVRVGSPVSASLTMSQSTLPLAAVTLTSSNLAFAVEPSPVSIPMGETVVVDVRFSPVSGGEQSGVITIDAVRQGQGELSPELRSAGPLRQSLVVGRVSVTGIGGPAVTVSPDILDFGEVLVGTARELTFRVANPGQVEAAVSVVTPGGSPFSVAPDSAVIPAGEFAEFRAQFTPSTIGLAQGVVVVTDAGGTTNVELSGVGLGFRMEPDRLDFGSVSVGTVSLPEKVTFTSSYPGALSVTAASSQGAFSVNPPLVSIPAEGTRMVEVTFAPTAAGLIEGIISFAVAGMGDQAVEFELELPVSGTGSDVLTLTPTSIDFGAVGLGSIASRQATLTNNGEVPFEVSSSTSNSVFLADPDAFMVPGGGQTIVDVLFAPDVAEPETGTISFMATSGDLTETLNLSVRGAGELFLTLTPDSMDFGEVAVNSMSAPQAGSLTNNSDTAFEVMATSSNPEFEVIPPAFALTPSGSMGFTVKYVPAAEGAASANITFEAFPQNGSGTPVRRELAASGIGAPRLVTYRVTTGAGDREIVAGDTVEFDSAVVGSSSSAQFELLNIGQGMVSIDAIDLSGAAFSFGAPPALPAIIEPGNSFGFSLTFQPPDLGSNQGTLAVNDSAFGLSGNGLLEGTVAITGLAPATEPLSQPLIDVELGSPAPRNLAGTLSLTVMPAEGLPADPMVQLQSGGASTSFTVPAGASSATFSGGEEIGLQVGTVAATIELTATLRAGAAGILREPATAATQVLANAPPGISAVTAERTASGISVFVTGFAPSREVTSATYAFTAASGIQLQPSSITPEGTAEAFQTWFADEGSIAFGSQFTLEQTFNIQGDASVLQSVTVTLSNAQGTSNSVTANIP